MVSIRKRVPPTEMDLFFSAIQCIDKEGLLVRADLLNYDQIIKKDNNIVSICTVSWEIRDGNGTTIMTCIFTLISKNLICLLSHFSARKTRFT